MMSQQHTENTWSLTLALLLHICVCDLFEIVKISTSIQWKKQFSENVFVLLRENLEVLILHFHSYSMAENGVWRKHSAVLELQSEIKFAASNGAPDKQCIVNIVYVL